MIRFERLNSNDDAWMWPTLLAAPVLMFANLAVTYALTPLLCRLGGTVALHLTCASFAVPTVAMTVGAVKTWQDREDRGGGLLSDAGGDDTVLPELASIVAALATLVIFAQWLAVWILPPCP